VRTQAGSGLTAVVSPMPAQPPRAARDDVLAHSDVLQALIGRYDVVPAAFGTVYPQGLDLDALPRGERRRLSRLLDDLSGRIELQVRATYDEVAITAALVESDSRLRRMRSARKQDYAAKLALGTRFAEVLDRRRRSDADTAAKYLSRLVDRVSIEPHSGEWGAFRLSLLVQRAKQNDIERALREFADRASYLQVDWLGPLPPYSFVDPPTAKRAG